MRNFRCAPLGEIRVGVVGLGVRGSDAVRRLGNIPGVRITAVCDIRRECVERAVAEAARSGMKPKTYGGSAEAYKGLCDSPDVDVVYNCTAWSAHVPIAVHAMKAGKHALIEVPSAMYVDECWELVETAEATHRHCMQLENCCYGEEELLALNLCRLGMLGELIHGEGGYIHDRRWQIFNDDQWERWRKAWNERHAGNQYSTHGLGPICLDMGINRGDRLDYLVSVDSHQAGYEAFAAESLSEDDPMRKCRFAMADMNVSIIRTAKGRTIMLQHDVSSPRPYSRLNLISGTKGILRSFPKLDVCLDNPAARGEMRGYHKFKDEETERIRREFMHPLYKAVGERVKNDPGHGGMDLLMDLRWVHCLRNGLPLDTDVYDLATWCSVSELTERSARNRAETVDVPDFTRGLWKQACNSNLMEATVA